MGLGTNRDYKTRDRVATRKLAAHFKRMGELMKTGMDREAASKQAYNEICDGTIKISSKP
jgi:hypothetical protein